MAKPFTTITQLEIMLGVEECRRTMEERVRVFPKALAAMTTAEQAGFADFVVRTHAKEEAFWHVACGWPTDPSDPRINTTSVGNGAYGALHGPTEEIRARCTEFLVKFKRLYSEQ